MNRVAHLAAAFAALALLLAPVAWACCGSDGAGSPCAMHAGAGMDSGSTPPTGPEGPGAGAHAGMQAKPCHGGESTKLLSAGCCGAGSTSSPVVAQTQTPPRHLTSLEAAGLDAIVPPAALDLAVRETTPEASPARDLGRYTLFLALLL